MKRLISMILVLALSILAIPAMAGEMQRIDSDGYLYYMDYTGDYYCMQVMDSLRKVGYIDPNGCLCVQFGPDKKDRIDIVRADAGDYFDIHTDRTSDGWEVFYKIPLEFFRLFCPDGMLRIRSS